MVFSRLRIGVAACALWGAMAITPVAAETLQDALIRAYQNNPVLEAQRAQLRATDEDVGQALAGWRPNVVGNASLARDRTDNFFADPPGRETQKPRNYSVQLQQPLFRSFRTVNATNEAKSRVQAGRQQLASTEQDVLLSTVAAFLDVRRDMSVLELRQNNVQVLTRQLEASRDRFEVGEITRTDVAQSEARLSGAVSSRIGAEADLSASRAGYQRIIGDNPGTLQPPPPLPPLPGSEEEALEIALSENPDLRAATFFEQASRHAVSAAKSELGPDVAFVAEYARSENTFVDGFSSDTTSLTLQATVPIYQSGSVSSRIRQSKHISAQRRIEVLQAEREVREQIRNAWEELRAARAIIDSSQAQVRANEIALEGVRQEADVGSRTTLDVLDAEQEFLDSQVELVRAQRNEYVAGFQLLAAIGRGTAAALNLPVDTYDPERNYRRATNTWFGWWGVDD